MSRTQYVFVDYENVQIVDLDLVAGKPVVVELLIGKQHTKLPVEMVEQMQKYSGQVKLVRVGTSGHNALDFVLACRVGAVSSIDAKGYFHIVSGDTGFDALIQHLRKDKILARRDKSFASAFIMETPAIAPGDWVRVVRESLKQNKTNRPKRVKTLLSQINSCLGKKLTEDELKDIVQTLTNERDIEVGENGEVSYRI